MNWFLTLSRPASSGRIWVFCDGGLGSAPVQPLASVTGPSDRRPVRPQAGCGAIVRAEQGDILDWAWRSLSSTEGGRSVTNNEAEYAGLLLGITLARRRRARETILLLDSEIVVGQMQGRFAVRSPALRRWHRQAMQAMRTLPRARFCLIPREWNPLADALARQAGLAWDPLRTALESALHSQTVLMQTEKT